MTTKLFCRSLTAVALAAGAASAQAQVALSCPAGAAAGTPTNPLTMYTGANGQWDIRYGTGGAWGPAVTGNKHSNWYPGGGAHPANGSWLMPGPFPLPNPGPSIPTVDPFFYRSPAITVDPQVDVSTIQVQIQQSADNFYRATGLVNAANPEAYVPYSGPNDFNVLQPAFTVAAGALPWAAGENRLILQGQNAEASYDPPQTAPTGVYAIVAITGTCKAAPQPAAVPVNNPWALLAVAAGLAGFGAQRLRRRKG